MKQELKETWIKALRSGKYKQAKDALCRISPEGETSYCCLGVLAKIVSPTKGWEKRKSNPAMLFQGLPDELNDPFLYRVGLRRDDMNILITLNDNDFSFERIADFLEVTDV